MLLHFSLHLLSLHLRHARVLSTQDFMAAFIATGLLSLISALLFVRLASDAGWELSGHERAPLRQPVETALEEAAEAAEAD
jgi:hypothetical protein